VTRRMAYRYEAAEPGLTVWADREKMEQVVLNLLSNALKFTERGSVSVSVTANADDVIIHVSDTGVGIPADKIDAVFQPFVQLESGLTRRAQGTGLGLAICRDIARAMNGDVSLTSELGKGSTFSLRLPRHRRR